MLVLATKSSLVTAKDGNNVTLNDILPRVCVDNGITGYE